MICQVNFLRSCKPKSYFLICTKNELFIAYLGTVYFFY
jgi:hypothetical protein